MVRAIKRYGSRKLYDTHESRYVSLEELAQWIRKGEEIQVADNKSGEDVTAQTLTQIISEEGRKGQSLIPNELLHDLIRAGGTAVTQRVRQVQDGIDRIVKKSIDRLGPVRQARDELELLKRRLEELESSLSTMEREDKKTT